jgi:hypothetical protein
LQELPKLRLILPIAHATRQSNATSEAPKTPAAECLPHRRSPC